MKRVDVELLAKICETPGVPGCEERIRSLVKNEIEELADEIRIDALGNLIAFRRGTEDNAKRVMVAAHMDEIGFMVKHIDEKGFLKFHPLGGFDPKTLTSQRVIVHGKEDRIGVMGSKPIHIMTPEERQKAPKIEDYYIDLGLGKEEVVELITPGDAVSRERKLIEMGNCVNCKSIDNRVSVYILIEVLKSLKGKDIPYDFYAVFTVQEEVGVRGAWVATHGINPDFGIALDTTIAYDTPGAKEEEKVTELGKGAAIKIMDASVISDKRMVDFMKEEARKLEKEKGLKWQTEILTAGGTDTMALQRMSSNSCIAGAISIPTRHIHQVIEMADKSDITAAIDLLEACLLHIHQYNWDPR